jgi:hypothetical protein
MNNERYNQIIDGVYKKHINSLFYDFSGEVKGYLLHEHLSKEEFIDKCKTDQEFSERWGLKIEKRELEFQERLNILGKRHPLYFMEQQLGGEDILTRNNIPTRAITLTYNNETIEVYE